ncbi:26S proteasome non-ATPase regulatory subunit 12 [Cryptosporidium felis]|nr:26S proteasome non-ATPase regulatory subunit 12 [Cryptosporidium felis]
MQEQSNKEQFNETVNPISELESLVKDPKCTQDLSLETEEMINEFERNGVGKDNFQMAVEGLMSLEKRCRQVSDSNSSCKVVFKIITWLINYSDSIDEPLGTVQKICKKRGQLKKVVSFIVQLFINMIGDSTVSLDQKLTKYNSFRKRFDMSARFDENLQSVSYEIKNMDECLKIIGTIDEITQGKIYLELERARLMLILSNIEQERGNVMEASRLLEDVTVETIGNMDLREKTQYVLEQMRLSLLCKDFVRLQIFAKKINPKIIEKFSDLKLVYYQYLIILWHFEQNPREISQCFFNLLNSVIALKNGNSEAIVGIIPEYMKSPISKYKLSEDVPSISSCILGLVIYLILGPYSSEMRKELVRFNREYQKYIERHIPYFSKFICDYINEELLFLESTKTFNYSIPSYFIQLSNCFFFSSNGTEVNGDAFYTEYKRCKINICNGSERFKLFIQRIQERNLAVISKYYSSISFQRIQDLLNMDGQELQIVINNLVERGIFSAKINQPIGKIIFSENVNSNGQFDKFHDNIGAILGKLDLLNDLISNDLMLHQFNSKFN